MQEAAGMVIAQSNSQGKWVITQQEACYLFGNTCRHGALEWQPRRGTLVCWWTFLDVTKGVDANLDIWVLLEPVRVEFGWLWED